MYDNFIIEIVIWISVVIIANKIDSQTMYRACDFYLIFIISGHSWKITIPVFIILFSLLRVWNWIGEFLLDVVFPELRSIIKDIIMKKIGIN